MNEENSSYRKAKKGARLSGMKKKNEYIIGVVSVSFAWRRPVHTKIIYSACQLGTCVTSFTAEETFASRVSLG